MGQDQYDPYQQHQPRNGYPPPPPPNPQYVYVVNQPQRPRTWMQTWTLILGLLGFVTCGFTSLIAIPLGHVALSEANSRPHRVGRESALAGLILAYLLIGGGLAYFLIVAFTPLGDL